MRYRLLLTTEEIKSLQVLLEDHLCQHKDEDLRDLLTKVIVSQVEASEPTTYERNHALESRFGPDAVE